MDHLVKIRGRPVCFEEVDDLIAFKPTRREETAPSAQANDLDPSLENGLTPFRRGGWFFLHPSKIGGWLSGLREHGKIAAVLRDQSGRVFLVTDKLVIQLSPLLSETEALQFLVSASLTPVRRLTFAPNLFVARVRDAGDPISEAAELSIKPVVDSVEPEFIEAFGLR